MQSNLSYTEIICKMLLAQTVLTNAIPNLLQNCTKIQSKAFICR